MASRKQKLYDCNGFCKGGKPANSIAQKKIYGVIPYIAPEIFIDEGYTKASDIYSFGMIMWEMITGQNPFSDSNHNELLVLDILNGLRPEIINNLPQEYIDLMKKLLGYQSIKQTKCL
ncbi:kinase-like domain-containing protein [Gigaspora rosea]|uniref:Kinase-like domain-containing protein n=1 Tax=Gigaspora rosea TaxID=44941 RepID=A0A397VIM1_9GLOM|nr:kinase-like domain-containing protein [Gigaspora rosea]